MEKRCVKGTESIFDNPLGNCSLLKKKDLQKKREWVVSYHPYRKIFTNNIISCCWNDNIAPKNQSKIFHISLENHALFMNITSTWVALIEQMKIAVYTVYLLEVKNDIAIIYTYIQHTLLAITILQSGFRASFSHYLCCVR